MAEAKMIVDIGVGEDFIEHSFSMDNDNTELSSLTNRVTRQYYEIVDKAILENMPTDVLKDLVDKATHELIKRGP